MNKWYKHILASVGIWIISGVHLNGQSIDSLIVLAWNNSSRVKALEAEYQAAKTIGNQMNTYPDPEISLGLGVLPVETRLGPQRLRLGASQMIPWPGLLSAKQALADAMAEIKSVDAESYMVEVTYQIKKAYYELYNINKKINLYDQQLAYLIKLKDIAIKRIESGDARLTDVLKIESKILELEGIKNQLQLASASPTYVINRFTFRPMSTPIVIERELELVRSESLKDLSISEEHPQLRKLMKMKEASLQSIELTHYQAKPKIGVGLDYIMVGQRSDAIPDGNGRDIVMPMGRISIPLNKASFDFKRQEERLKMEAINHYENDFTQDGMKEIQASLNVIDQAVNSYKWNEEIVINNNTTIELILTAYTSSEASIEELLALYLDNIAREQAKIDAILKSHLAKAKIEKYQTPVSF